MQDFYLRTPDEAVMRAALIAAGLMGSEGEALGCAIDMVGEIADQSGYCANVRLMNETGINLAGIEPWRIYPSSPVRTFAGALPPVPSIAEIRATKWLEIKAERDRRKAAGVKVGEQWFHSDADSRIQQLGLVMFGVAVPPVLWKTMDGTKVPMTQELANQIFQAVAAYDQAIFVKAEEHRAAMESSTDPANYDYSTGWPAIYGE